MAAKVGGLNPTFFNLPIKPSSSPFQAHYLYTPKKKTQQFRISANFGGGEGDAKKKKFITREEEPEHVGKGQQLYGSVKVRHYVLKSASVGQSNPNKFKSDLRYWQSAGEREGENPMKTPLPYIIIFGMSTPFVILAIAFANGWIKVPIR